MIHYKLFPVLLALTLLLAASAPAFTPPDPSIPKPVNDRLAATQQSNPPIFIPAPCMFETSNLYLEELGVECGYLTAPLDHNLPDGPTIQLAVVILKSQASNPRPDPLFILQGGPGGSTIDTYADLLITKENLREDRDLVLFDQRGTLYSKPLLYCPEIDQLILDTLEIELDDEQSFQMEEQATRRCHDRLIEEGIDLSAFDSLQNAADIDALRQALGYEQINLYGVSYGTLLALHTLRAYPETLRSVVLDAVVPPQRNFLLDVPQSMQRSFSQFFQACATHPDCNRAYPDLEKVFFELVEQLEDNPAHVPMTDPDSGITYQALFDGESFLSSFFQMLYATSLIPALPRMIYDARDGNFEVFARIMEIFIFDRTMSYGMYYSILCAEDADFGLQEYDLSGVHPLIAEMEANSPAEFLQICQLWDVEPLSSEIDQAVVSQVPTLVLSGGLDPITPPPYGEAAAATLSNAYVYIFPAGGHGQALEGDCQDEIILSFLENPNQAPDSSCIQALSTPDFYTPASLIDLPVVIKFLNLDPVATIEFFVLLFSLLFLLSAWLALPLAALIRRSQRDRRSRKPAPDIATPPALGNEPAPAIAPQAVLSPPIQKTPQAPHFLVRRSGLLALLNSLCLLIFVSALGYWVVKMVMDNDNRLFYGINAAARGWFILPMLFLLITLGMLFVSLQTWRKRHWSIWGRLYYTTLTLAALASLFVLGKWGILTALV